MVIDTSAVIAILEGEPEAAILIETIRCAPCRLMSAAAALETHLVAIHRRGDEGDTEVELFLARAGIEVVPVTAEQVRVARDGFLRFGKGRHKASLNFGDCFSYALAKVQGYPLIFKGNDFGFTHVAVAEFVRPMPSPV